MESQPHPFGRGRRLLAALVAVVGSSGPHCARADVLNNSFEICL
jgi:hypothetical protein